MGAYGLQVTGAGTRDLQATQHESQVVDLRVEHVEGLPAWAARFDDHVLRLPQAKSALATVERATGQAVLYSTRRVRGGEFAHPFLSVAGIAFAHWRGAEPLHAGALLLGGGAVLLVGGKGAGKSSTLAAAAVSAIPVIADDLSVVENLVVLPGSRTIDLRASAARRAGLWEETRSVRGRRRLSLSPAPSAPLKAIVDLTWGKATALEPVGISDRLRIMLQNRFLTGCGPGARPVPTDMLAVEWRRFQRPRRPELVFEALDRLVEEFA